MTNAELQDKLEQWNNTPGFINPRYPSRPSLDIMEDLLEYDWLRALCIWKASCIRYGLTAQVLCHLTGRDGANLRKSIRSAYIKWHKNGPHGGVERKVYRPGFYDSGCTYENFLVEFHWCSTTQLPVYEFVFSQLYEGGRYTTNISYWRSVSQHEDPVKFCRHMMRPELLTKEGKNWTVFEDDLKVLSVAYPDRDEQVRNWRTSITPFSWDLLKKAVAFS